MRAWEAAKATGVRLVVGRRLDLTDGKSILVYPIDRSAYSRLMRLLSLGKARGDKGNCLIRARGWRDRWLADQATAEGSCCGQAKASSKCCA